MYYLLKVSKHWIFYEQDSIVLGLYETVHEKDAGDTVLTASV